MEFGSVGFLVGGASLIIIDFNCCFNRQQYMALISQSHQRTRLVFDLKLILLCE